MDRFKYDVTVRVFAEQAKRNHREWLAYRMFAQHLKMQGYTNVDGTVDEARRSPEFQAQCSAYDRAIDAKIPPSASDLDEAIRIALEALPPTEFPN
jgi:hypothetical protein